jgi:hypothetical protein
MMSSVCTLRLNRRSAFSRGSPSCTRTSANLDYTPQLPIRVLFKTTGIRAIPQVRPTAPTRGSTAKNRSLNDVLNRGSCESLLKMRPGESTFSPGSPAPSDAAGACRIPTLPPRSEASHKDSWPPATAPAPARYSPISHSAARKASPCSQDRAASYSGCRDTAPAPLHIAASPRQDSIRPETYPQCAGPHARKPANPSRRDKLPLPPHNMRELQPNHFLCGLDDPDQ